VFTCTGLCLRSFGNSCVFLKKAKSAKITTMMLSEIVIERTVIPIGDNPRNKPDTPAMLKLKATDKTVFSTRSSFPS